MWQDVLGGVDYLRDIGATKVIVAGASLGAMASLYVAQLPDAEVNGVIWLAGVLNNSGFEFTKDGVAEIGCPMLLISGDEDAYGAAADTRKLRKWATESSELLILPSALHGTDILGEGEPNAGRLNQAMLDYVGKIANDSTTC